jgi:FkbM family methyltransferase
MVLAEREQCQGAMMHLRHVGFRVLSSAPSVYLTDIVVRRVYGGKLLSRGRMIDTNDASVSPWVRTLIFWDMYENAELQLIQQFLPKDIDVIELGGSIGVVASQIAGSLDGGRRLVSVEGNPSLIELLKRNVEANGCRDCATVIHGAVAYATPPSDFVSMSFGDSSLAGWLSDSPEQSSGHQVPCVTLGALISRYQFERFALIADIEGAEAGIFFHDKEILIRCCPLMIVELHETTFEGRRLSIPDLVTMAKELGYTVKDNRRNVYVFENLALGLSPAQ